MNARVELEKKNDSSYKTLALNSVSLSRFDSIQFFIIFGKSSGEKIGQDDR